jgi:Domain of unknown function (DUF929)
MIPSGDRGIKGVRRITYLALVIGIANLIVISDLAVEINHINKGVTVGTSSTTTTYTNLSATGPALIPPTSFSSAPIINTTSPLGLTLYKLNAPLNASQLDVFNEAPSAYFETAGEMFLNGSITNTVGSSVVYGPQVIYNGKPTVVYVGANTCIFCGENRWAMALALGRFGNFSRLFVGYSSLQDGDLPTVYWAPSEYNTSQGFVFGNFYNSSYFSFVSMEYQSPITDEVQLPSLSYLLQQADDTTNYAYSYSVDLIGTLNYYIGTPYTTWGRYIVPGADAEDFGNSSLTSSKYPLANLTHTQVFADLSHPKDQFGWTEYAAADLYVAMVCATINNTAPICSLNAIQQIEQQLPQTSGTTTLVTEAASAAGGVATATSSGTTTISSSSSSSSSEGNNGGMLPRRPGGPVA